VPTFDAGSISSTLELDRSPFNRELDLAKADADEFSKKRITPTVELDTKDASKQLAALNRQMTTLSKKTAKPNIQLSVERQISQLDRITKKLDELGSRKARPDVDLGGIARTEAAVTLLQRQINQLDRSKAQPKVNVDTRKSEQGITRLLDGIIALAPALIPVTGAAVGGGTAIATAFTAAGVGAGAFALAAVPAIKKVADGEDALNTAVQSRTAAQKQSLQDLSKSELDAAKGLQGLVQTYHGFSDALEPTVFVAMAKAEGLATDGLHKLAPIAHTTGDALVDLEDDAHRALDSQFYKTFFNYLGVEAPRSVNVFGRSLGNFATGAAGIMQTFLPVEHQVEDGILHLSQRWANFGKNSGGNDSVQSFMQYVQTEGPQVVHLIGQAADTIGDLAKAGAPIGGVEIRALSDLLSIVDRIAKDHPDLAASALALLTISKATSALKLGSLVSTAGGSAKSISGVVVGVGGLIAGGKTLEQVFPKVAKAMDTAETASTGLQVGLLSLGETVGGGIGAGIALTGGIAALAAGIGILGYQMEKNGSSADQFVKSLIKSDDAAGNNVVGYTKAKNALQDYIKAQHNAPAYRQGYNPYGATVNYEATSGNIDTAADAYRKLDQQQKNVISGAQRIQNQFGKLGPQYQLTTKQALQLADSNKLDLSKGFDLSTAAGQKNALILANLIEKTKEHIAEVKLSHDPTAQFSKDISLAGNSAQTAQQQIQGMDQALEGYQSLMNSVADSSAAAGDALHNLGKDSLTAAGAQAILSNNLLHASPVTRKTEEDLSALSGAYTKNLESMFSTEVQSKGTAKAFADVSAQTGKNKEALIPLLRQMGLNATQAKELADKYAGIPKDITTKAHLLGVKQAESDAAGIRQKILDIPLGHTTTTKADVAKAQQNIADLKLAVQHLPKSAQIKAQAEIRDAEQALDNLESHIYDLTHKTWSVTIKSDGSVQLPSLSHGPVATPDSSLATHRATGGPVVGPGGPRADKVLLWGSNGEFMQQASAVRREGVPAMQALNDGRATIVPLYAGGGLIDVTAATNAASLVPFVDGLTSQLKSAQKYAASVSSSGLGPSVAAGPIQEMARQLLAAHGWAGQWAPFNALEMREAGWNPRARNPSSGAAGLAQALPASKYPPGAWPYTGTRSAELQLQWMMQYIDSSYGSPAGAWAHEVAHNWYGNGLVGGIFTKPTLIGVGEKGPERVDVTPIKGYAGGGQVITSALRSDAKTYASEATAHIGIATPRADIDKYTNAVITQIEHKFKGYKADFLITFVKNAEAQAIAHQKAVRDAAGQHLLDVIMSGFTGSRAQATIKSTTGSVIHSIDADFTGAKQSGLVSYTQRVNNQMLGLAKQRDKIAAQISNANQIASTVTQDAQQFGDLTNLGGTAGPADIITALTSKANYITSYDKNLSTLSKRGLSKDAIAQLTAEGISTSGPIAEQLATASKTQIAQINSLEKRIGVESRSLGTTAVDAQLGGTIAKNFVKGLQSQESLLEKQMNALARVFAKGIGKQFHLKGYSSGGVTTGEPAIFGEHGAEIGIPPAGTRIIPASTSRMLSRFDYNEMARAIAAAMPTRNGPLIEHAEFHDNSDVTLTIQKMAFAAQAAGLG
jgi:hypothetical protein